MKIGNEQRTVRMERRRAPEQIVRQSVFLDLAKREKRFFFCGFSAFGFKKVSIQSIAQKSSVFFVFAGGVGLQNFILFSGVLFQISFFSKGFGLIGGRC